jgi:hypothetical protein
MWLASTLSCLQKLILSEDQSPDDGTGYARLREHLACVTQLIKERIQRDCLDEQSLFQDLQGYPDTCNDQTKALISDALKDCGDFDKGVATISLPLLARHRWLCTARERDVGEESRAEHGWARSR